MSAFTIVAAADAGCFIAAVAFHNAAPDFNRSAIQTMSIPGFATAADASAVAGALALDIAAIDGGFAAVAIPAATDAGTATVVIIVTAIAVITCSAAHGFSLSAIDGDVAATCQIAAANTRAARTALGEDVASVDEDGTVGCPIATTDGSVFSVTLSGVQFAGIVGLAIDVERIGAFHLDESCL